MKKPIKVIYVNKGSLEIINKESPKVEVKPSFIHRFEGKAPPDSPLVKSLLILDATASEKRN